MVVTIARWVAALGLLAQAEAFTQQDPAAMAWRAYGDFVATFLVGQNPLGPKDRLYINPPTLGGIAGGSPVSDARTNEEVFNVADGLLGADDPFYRKTEMSYVNAYSQYLNRVQTSLRVPSEAEATQLASLRTVADNAQMTWFDVQDAAWLRWDTLKTRGMISSTTTFTQWVVTGYPTFLRALDEARTAENRYQLYKQTIEGGSSDGWADQKGDLSVATQGTIGGVPGFSPGLNMKCDPRDQAIGTPGTTAVEPADDNVLLRAHYSLPGLEDQCNAWMGDTSGQSTRWTFSFNSASMHDWSSYGYSKSTAGANAGWSGLFGLLGVRASGGTTTTTTEYNRWTETFTQNVEMTLTLKGAPIALDFDAGAWDVGDPRLIYPNRITGTTDPLKGYVRPFRVLLGYQPGLRLVVKDTETFNSIRDYIQTNTRAGSAGIRIFGFNIGGSAGSSYTYSSTDIVSRADTTNGGSFEIPPANTRRPFLLGVVGTLM